MGQYQLGVIGSGTMAEVILRGALVANVIHHNTVIATDPRFPRRQLFTRELGVASVEDNKLAAACPYVLLAVKPQQMAEVLGGIADAVSPETTIISIAAGVKTAFIRGRLGGKGRVVRVMPNTPLLAGAGVSALAAGEGASASDLDWPERLFGACGKTVRVEESSMDAVTAVSGSGPAYVFYLVEAMIEAGVAEGLDRDVATELAVQTCVGAGRLLAKTGETPQVLRARVTSPNGTTQAAIESMDGAGVFEAVVAAVRRAAERSRELGK